MTTTTTPVSGLKVHYANKTWELKANNDNIGYKMDGEYLIVHRNNQIVASFKNWDMIEWIEVHGVVK